YTAVFGAFRKANAGRPAAALRALILSQQFSNELRSRNTSAAIFDLNGGRVAWAAASLGTDEVPTLTNQAYVDAVQGKGKTYYVASGNDGTTNYLVVLNVIRNGTRPLGLAQLAIPTSEIDQTLRADLDRRLHRRTRPAHRGGSGDPPVVPRRHAAGKHPDDPAGQRLADAHPLRIGQGAQPPASGARPVSQPGARRIEPGRQGGGGIARPPARGDGAGGPGGTQAGGDQSGPEC